MSLNTIENKLKEVNLDDIYGIDLRKSVDDIYNQFVSDKRFMEQVAEPLNSKSSLYIVFSEKLEDILIGISDDLALYNILTDNSYTNFFNDWKTEMFNKIYSRYRT